MDRKPPITAAPRGLAMIVIIGPAFVWCAEYIGSGEVILATRMGAILGYTALWAPIFGIILKTCIGIGGDPIIGTTTLQAVKMLMNDEQTEGIIMIGEIGGTMEADAAYWIKEHGTKPVVGFIAGQTAPKGRRMGHAGAIIGGKDDTAEAKMKIMKECGIHVVQSPADIGQTMFSALKK